MWLKKFILLFLLLLCPAIASAQWSTPITATNIWYGALERYSIVPQAWSYSFGNDNNLNNYIQTFPNCFAGYFPNIVVIGGITYTNFVPHYITLGVTNSMRTNTAPDAMKGWQFPCTVVTGYPPQYINYTYTSATGSTESASAYVTRNQIGLLDYAMRNLTVVPLDCFGGHALDTLCAPPIYYWADTSEAPSGDYDSWFDKTDPDTGLHPTYIPTWNNLPNMMHRLDDQGKLIGCLYNTCITNSPYVAGKFGTMYGCIVSIAMWGNPVLSPNFGDVDFAKFWETPKNLYMENPAYQGVFTNNAWEYRTYGFNAPNLMDLTNMFPIVRYVTTNTTIPAIQVYVAGDTWPFSVTNNWFVGLHAPGLYSTRYPTSNQFEVVICSGSNTPLLKKYYAITNFTILNYAGACTGDSVTVMWTNAWKMSPPGIWQDQLDDYATVIKEFKWTVGYDGDWDAGTNYYWYGASSNDWADALATCQASTPVITPSGGGNAPGERTVSQMIFDGWGPGTNYWTAEAYTRSSKAVITVRGVNTDTKLKTANYYSWANSNAWAGGEYNPQAGGIPQNDHYQLLPIGCSATISGVCTSDIAFGSIFVPPYWTDPTAPTTSVHTLGYQLQVKPLGVAKWVFIYN